MLLRNLCSVLLASAVVADSEENFGVPPPPPPNPCKWSPPGHPEIVYDLSPFERVGDIDVPGTNGEHFFVHVCGAPTRRCEFTEVEDPAGINTWVSGGGEATCAAIGSSKTGTWALTLPSKPESGVQLSYTGGDPAFNAQGQAIQRSATIVFKCASSEVPIGVSAAEVPIHSLHYSIVLSGEAACPQTPQPLSWGWWTVIWFCLISAAYFGGGSYYNSKYTEAEGLECIPQWQYWQQLPGLVYDGSVFFLQEAKFFSRKGHQYLRDWYEGIGSKELKEPIASVQPAHE